MASRSAEAAKEIKVLVETATKKADQGKKISQDMISGYKMLNENISQTISNTRSETKVVSSNNKDDDEWASF